MDEAWEKAKLLSPAGEQNHCWLWQRGKTKDGYGCMSFAGKQFYVHRLALEHNIGRPLDEGMMALHSCHNPSCWNPMHLREGTHADNMADREAAGRTASGDRNAMTKVSGAKLREIRDLRGKGMTQDEIGKKVGLSQSTISDALRRLEPTLLGSHDETNPDRPHHSPDNYNARHGQLARDTRQQLGFTS